MQEAQALETEQKELCRGRATSWPAGEDGLVYKHRYKIPGNKKSIRGILLEAEVLHEQQGDWSQ